MRVGLIGLNRFNGGANTVLSLAKGLTPHCELAGIYLSAANPLADQWRASELYPSTRWFETYSGYPSLVAATVRGKHKAVGAAIDADRLDVVIDTHPGVWAGLIKQSITATSTVLADIVHDPEPHPDRFQLRSRFRRRFLPSEPDVLIGLADASSDRLTELHPDRPVIRSRHGANGAAGYDENELTARAKEAASNAHRFLYFGRIEAYKGVPTLVQAFAAAREDQPDLELTIAGSGPLDDETSATAGRLGANVLNRFIEESEVSELLNTHGCLVLPYLSATQSGPASLALANALPAIATDVGGLPEQIRHGENGLIVPPGDVQALAKALVEFRNEPLRASAMARRAYELCTTDYDWSHIGKRLIDDLRAHCR